MQFNQLHKYNTTMQFNQLHKYNTTMQFNQLFNLSGCLVIYIKRKALSTRLFGVFDSACRTFGAFLVAI